MALNKGSMTYCITIARIRCAELQSDNKSPSHVRIHVYICMYYIR